MSKPIVVKIIIGLTVVQIIGICLVFGLVFYAALATPENEFARGVRSGFFDSMGLAESQEIGPREMGYLTGRMSIFLLLSGLVLFLIKSKKLWGLRIVLAVEIATSGFLALLPLVSFVLSFLRPTGRYMRVETVTTDEPTL